jgi:hypothetical protein
MRYKKELGLLALVIILVIAVSYGTLRTDPVYQKSEKVSTDNTAKKSTVTIGTDEPINVEIADTPQKRSKGLAGREHLSDGEGMLFPFTDPNHTAIFWMKGMLIPIDMIWIKNGTIIQIDRNVPPEPDMSDFQLTLYSPSTPVDYVLEVRGGLSDEKGFSKGDQITVNNKDQP